MRHAPNGINARLRVRLGAVLQDGGAHKAVFHAKGDGGTRMCFLCNNLVADRSRLVDGENQLTCKLLSRSQLCMANGKGPSRVSFSALLISETNG